MTERASTEGPELVKEWQTDKLGLAAFASLNGAQLLRIEGRFFVMKSADDLAAVSVKYANSVESEFNNKLISLNEMRRSGAKR